MSQMLKCPNPSCPYIFDPSHVPVGVVLSCPRCAMQFTLGPPPGAQAPPPPEPQNAEFEALGGTAVEEHDLEEVLPPRGASKAQVFILAGIAAVLMAGTALTLIFLFLRKGDDGGGSGDGISKLPDYNIGVEAPPAGWTRDENMRVKVGSPFSLAYRRENPEAYMAFGATVAPKGQAPRPSQMKRELEEPFRRLFDPSTVERKNPEATSWLGESISSADALPNGFQFRAQSTDGLTWKGEAYTVASKGIAYFWLSWCGENDFDSLKSEFATFRQKFKLLELRKDWKETRANVVDFKGDRTPYTLSDAEDSWKEVPDEQLKELQAIEPDLDKKLRISLTPRRDRKARPEVAELAVYVLTGGDNPAETARKFAEEKEVNRIKQANSELTPPKFKELTGQPEGDPTPDTVPANAPVARLVSEIADAPSNNRLIVTSGLKVGDKTVVVICWCEAKKRGVFESKFVQIAASLR